MKSRFEIYQHPILDRQAVTGGFNWAALPLPWLWALRHRLWFLAALLALVEGGLVLLAQRLHSEVPVSLAVLFTGFHLLCAFKAGAWRARRLQGLGYLYLGSLPARDAADACAKVRQTGGQILPEWRGGIAGGRDWFPRGWRPALAVARLAILSGFRFRLVPLLLAVLLAIVIGLPLLLKDDGTAHGLMQIIISYTLASVTAVMVAVTLWLSTGTLAREVEDALIQMVTVKPIPRWQIWLGKWLGIMTINLGLLGASGFAVHLIVHWRAQALPEAQRKIMLEDLLVARASVRPPVPDLDRLVEEAVRERLAGAGDASINIPELRKLLRQQLEAGVQLVAPGYIRRWEIPVGQAAGSLRDNPAQIRVKFRTSAYSVKPEPRLTHWEVGPPESPRRLRMRAVLTTDTFHELKIEPGLVDEHGMLFVEFLNASDGIFLFDPAEGVELLYREGSFGLNFARALAIIFCWLGLAAALGLTAASKLGFNVASFFALGLAAVGLFSGTMANVIKDGTIWHANKEQLSLGQRQVDVFMVPAIKVLERVTKLVRDYSPIESLSLGRSVTWLELARAYGFCWGLLGGLIAALGMALLTGRELATAQNQT